MIEVPSVGVHRRRIARARAPRKAGGPAIAQRPVPLSGTEVSTGEPNVQRLAGLNRQACRLDAFVSSARPVNLRQQLTKLRR
jgi:hypothetical protein